MRLGPIVPPPGRYPTQPLDSLYLPFARSRPVNGPRRAGGARPGGGRGSGPFEAGEGREAEFLRFQRWSGHFRRHGGNRRFSPA